MFVAVDERGEAWPAMRVEHDREQYRQFLEGLPAGSQIALEAGGHCYWMVDDMEAAGHRPRLAHPYGPKTQTADVHRLNNAGAGSDLLLEQWIVEDIDYQEVKPPLEPAIESVRLTPERPPHGNAARHHHDRCSVEGNHPVSAGRLPPQAACR